MAPHIVSWRDSPIVSSAAPSSLSSSVVPIESLLSDPYTKSPIIPEAWRARTTDPGVRPANFPSGGSETSDGPRQQSNDTFLQHSKYFFKDGNVTFLVDGFLYCVHRYFFSRDSVYFSTRFTQLGVRDHEASSTIVSLGDVESKDFEAFLSVLYPQNFDDHDLSYEQWRSVLHLSTRWGFESLRKLALRSIKPPTAHDRLLLSRRYAVDDWVVPALTALCERTAPLSLDEARGMSIEDVVLIAAVREDIRSKVIRREVESSGISRRIEAMQAGTPIPAAGYELELVSPPSEIPELRPGSPVYANDVPCSPVHGSVWSLEPPTMEPQGEYTERMPERPQPPGVAIDEWGVSEQGKKKKKGKMR
ncbi:hypothetical protein EI94DRAFT_1723356 [Lactarius quietus]|nr:hypothetical protein EI94DRAFT_1723356 [Lactarius quietus]